MLPLCYLSLTHVFSEILFFTHHMYSQRKQWILKVFSQLIPDNGKIPYTHLTSYFEKYNSIRRKIKLQSDTHTHLYPVENRDLYEDFSEKNTIHIP